MVFVVCFSFMASPLTVAIVESISASFVSRSCHIYNLLTADTVEAHHFHEHICSYNSSLAFPFMGENLDLPVHYGPYRYQIHGQIYIPLVRSSPPSQQTKRLCLQLYILEGNQPIQEHLQHPKSGTP